MLKLSSCHYHLSLTWCFLHNHSQYWKIPGVLLHFEEKQRLVFSTWRDFADSPFFQKHWHLYLLHEKTLHILLSIQKQSYLLHEKILQSFPSLFQNHFYLYLQHGRKSLPFFFSSEIVRRVFIIVVPWFWSWDLPIFVSWMWKNFSVVWFWPWALLIFVPWTWKNFSGFFLFQRSWSSYFYQKKNLLVMISDSEMLSPYHLYGKILLVRNS